MALARERASENVETETTLASALEEAHDRVIGSGVATAAKDPPHIAQAFVTVGNALTKHSRSARAKISAWKGRVARGLWVEGFGADAESMRKRILGSFDSETLAAAGLPLVASYRMEMRSQLASFVDSSIRELFVDQVTNVEKSAQKKFRDQLLRKLDVPPEDAPTENAAALRSALFSFESIVGDLEVPSLSLTKAKVCRDMEARLTDEVLTFADSPAAQIKRTKKVTKVANKEKKPGQLLILVLTWLPCFVPMDMETSKVLLDTSLGEIASLLAFTMMLMTHRQLRNLVESDHHYYESNQSSVWM
jgi:hypothetical protein